MLRNRSLNLRRSHILSLLFIGLSVAFLSLLLSSSAFATPGQQPDREPGVSNETCLDCHEQPDRTTELPSGESLFLTIDREMYEASIHGQGGYACVQCHVEIRSFPHPEVQAESRREFTLRMNHSCERCHIAQYQANLESVHQFAVEAGNLEAAVCSDCHGAHDVGPPDEPRSRIPITCGRCHSQINELYAVSAHGQALLGEGNPDVPSCVDCHGEHAVRGPSSSPFRLFSPQVCAECHSDAELMVKYGISTNVFNSYVSDFHGSTVVLFEQLAPDQETNKPVCIDCHNVHDIRPVDDPDSPVIKENLLTTCQRCHPDATTEFSGAWLSHYEPSREKHPIVYYVDQFYRFFIPLTIGGMLLFVTTDGGRRIAQRLRRSSDD